MELEDWSQPYNWSTWQPAIHATLLFVVQDERILLIRKKRGLGMGKINGPGGKIDPGETPLAAAIRETKEELCITPQAPRELGQLQFALSDYPNILCHVFRADAFTGTPTETPEAEPLWFPTALIPYAEMWQDDIHWLPHLLENRSFRGRFAFAGDTLYNFELEVDHLPRASAAKSHTLGARAAG